MDDTTKTILIAAGSGTIGAAITQICSLINNYYTDKRKYQAEQNKVIVLRKIEIGEHAVFHLGLAIQMFRKFVNQLENASKFTTDEAYNEFTKFVNEQRTAYLKSETDNALVNFIPIYFKVQTNFTDSAIRDSKTNIMNAEGEELQAKIKTDPTNYNLYIKRLEELRLAQIEHLNLTIQLLENDYETIVNEVRQLVTNRI
ncbi:MAG: hypothetical protein JWQ79_1292 [Mucilaginibacter sp.]|nr:hypothetical protein [Mucilaginibacter sp.]